MKILKKEIENNDVYALAVTKKYIVINSNYKGLTVFDKNFSFVTEIDVDEELVIYQMYASTLNDYVIIQDLENETLYSVEVKNKKIVKMQCTTFFMQNYYVDGSRFRLMDGEKNYFFTYDNLLFTVEEHSVNGLTYLTNNQEEIIYRDYEKIIYDDGKMKKELLYNSKGYFYSIKDKKIIKYDEEELYLWENDEWILLYEAESSYSIRQCILENERCYFLINNKGNRDESELACLFLEI
ncbi:hypothetical protein [Enterococcus sp. LJL51]|uniref:hypothetical protein n=1 Tax=Enterococcus sp. LJL51 TaxID=3416656 RepID=UPI003CF987CA